MNESPAWIQDIGVFSFGGGAVVTVDDVQVEGVGQEHDGVDDDWRRYWAGSIFPSEIFTAKH